MKKVALVEVDEAFDRYMTPEEKRELDDKIEKALAELKKESDSPKARKKRKMKFIAAFLKK